MEEIKNENLDNKAVEMTADQILKNKKGFSVPYPLVNTSGFFYGIIGPSGSGKTTILINLLKKSGKTKDKKFLKSYYGIFNNIIYVSPSSHTLKNNIFDELTDNKKFSNLNPEVFETVEQMTEETDKKGKRKHTLLILDDVSTDLKNSDILKDFIRLSKNRRHINLSIIVILHKITDAPPSLRANMNLIFIKKPKTLKEINAIYEEFILFDRKKFGEMLDFIYKNTFDFMIIDQTLRKSPNFEFFRNYNLIKFT
jgi:Cdc6-like AAA superfamily ATPase